MNDFVHLHVHSEYSLLDGYAATSAIVARAVELGMNSIALTDHGVMYGVIEFYTNAQKAGIKPILGLEAYMAPGSRRDAANRGAKNYYHLLLLAKDEVGYRNLVRLTTRAHLDGMGKGVFARPRIDRELLEQYHDGLIVTSACIAGEIAQRLKEKEKEQAREIAAYYRDLLGPENYFLELQLHDNTPELEEINDELVRIGKELGIPLVVTNDTHFVRPEDLEAHKMILALGYNMTLKELCAKNYHMDETYHIMSGEEMWRRFKKYGTAPLENTCRIAERCNLKLEFGRVQLPTIDIPEGHDAASYLRLVCEEGLMRRFNGAPPEEYVKRLEYELDVINQTGFPDYMLIVWDYVKFARSRGIPCLPRGSAGASLILYCLGITDVDPVKNKLLFERFLSPERLEMPDIDIDFADSRRHEVLEYIAEKYGRENTAQIITYGTLGAKAAIRDIGRVLDIPPSEVDRVAKLIPALPVGTTIAQALERVPELRRIYETNPELAKLIDWAQKVEGRMKSVGTHACGVVVSRTPLEEIVPLQRTTKDEHALMAAFEGSTLQKMGLLKMDVLGLTNLSVVAEALEYIAQTTGRKMELSDIPLDDPKVFEALSRGETANVFQLESPGMTRYLMQLKPTRVEDLYAMIALYRPGPLEQIPVYIHNKNNPQDIKYLHPILKPILEDTYGVIVYQEQIMRLLQEVADYTLGQAYIVIKAISKKDKKLMAENEVKFKQGCLKKGLTQEQADQLWELILPFAGYSFNRPHSTLYGLLSYQTAWLKVNYPVEYMAAVLKGAGGVTDDIAKAVNECRQRGVPVLGPNINDSALDFTIREFRDPADGQLKRGILFGLAAIKNVGAGPIEAILRERDANGPFRSLEDLCERVDRHALNKRVLESLIKCGALDSLPGNRWQKLEILDAAMEAGARAQKNRETGQIDMFGGIVVDAASAAASIPLPAIEETAERRREKLAWEKELLGVVFSSDPRKAALAGATIDHRVPLAAIRDAEGLQEYLGKVHTFAGMLTRVRALSTKKGEAMLVAALEDENEDAVELVAFPKAYEKYRDLLRQDALLIVQAKVDERNGAVQLVLESAAQLDLSEAEPPPAESEMDLEGLAEEGDLGAFEPVASAAALQEPDAPAPAAVPSVSAALAPSALADAPAASPPPGKPSLPPITTPVSIIKPHTTSRPRATPTANGNGHDHHAPATNGGTTQRRTMRLRFRRSANQEADIRLMQHVYDLLRGRNGADQVVIQLDTADRRVLLRMRQTVACDDGLIDTLRGVLGSEGVAVE
ncbi:MAG: DNA polymerase III subunit alpha [Roseiflexus sp.]|nr:DNA polymerase III subunit alpha [Roseiflexus sp.]MCS7289872.1 DNA polymerase III subunit alpha [Roseiflexus sp.]MDW8231806.1 DNA polymerase III subunit alpha [Roseiflexaceae bacterium]